MAEEAAGGTVVSDAPDAAAQAAALAADAAAVTLTPEQQATADAEKVAADAKAATDAAAALAATQPPEKYDLKLPEGSTLEVALIERTAANARALGLSNEAGQKLLDSVAAEIVSRETAAAQAWEPGKGEKWLARDAEWQATSLKDATIGGSPEKLQESIDLSKTVLTKFGGEDAVAFLNATGLGSHPTVIKMFATIGRSMSEGSLVLGPTGAIKVTDPAEKLYGGTPKV